MKRGRSAETVLPLRQSAIVAQGQAVRGAETPLEQSPSAMRACPYCHRLEHAAEVNPECVPDGGSPWSRLSLKRTMQTCTCVCVCVSRMCIRVCVKNDACVKNELYLCQCQCVCLAHHQKTPERSQFLVTVLQETFSQATRSSLSNVGLSVGV